MKDDTVDLFGFLTMRWWGMSVVAEVWIRGVLGMCGSCVSSNVTHEAGSWGVSGMGCGHEEEQVSL